MKMREWFSDPSRWTQKTLYRDKEGARLPDDDHINQAIASTCVVGACRVCYGMHIHDVLQRIHTALNIDNVPLWNDHPRRTFADVKSLCEQLDI